MAELKDAFLGEVSPTNFLLFLFAIVLTFVLGSLASVLISRYLKGKTERAVYKTVSKIVMYLIYAFGLFFAVNKIIHFDISASLAALGILGALVLITAAPILQNIIAGIVLAFERPFKEEDIVE